MGMTVSKRKDSRIPHVLMHKVADIRGGVSVNTAELGGDFLHEGAVLSVPVDGICHVVKVAVLTEQATATTIKVKKGHNFVVGNFVMADEGGLAYGITKIDTTNKDYDTITVKTALGTLEKGTCIVEAKAESAGTSSALKYTPFAIAGTGKPIVPGDNIDNDAWVIAVTQGLTLPDCVTKHLKGIINY